jgi:hypothetical protein
MPLDIAMQNVIAGSGSAAATLKGSTLNITGTFTGLKTPATVARVHRSAKPGMRGAPIGDLTVTTETSGTDQRIDRADQRTDQRSRRRTLIRPAA